MNDDQIKEFLELPKRIEAAFDWPNARVSSVYFMVQRIIAEWLEENKDKF